MMVGWSVQKSTTHHNKIKDWKLWWPTVCASGLKNLCSYSHLCSVKVLLNLATLLFTHRPMITLPIWSHYGSKPWVLLSAATYYKLPSFETAALNSSIGFPSHIIHEPRVKGRQRIYRVQNIKLVDLNEVINILQQWHNANLCDWQLVVNWQAEWSCAGVIQPGYRNAQQV